MAVLGVKKWNGSIVYYSNPSSVDDSINNPWPPHRKGGGGGISGGGVIWSSVEQVIWIKYGGAPPYPVYLKPGNNDVKFWIPTLYPDDGWIEATLEIEAPGYILIPAGFEWDVLTGENVPPARPNSKRIDKIRFRDYYDVVINNVPPPPAGDPYIDEISFRDIYGTDLNNILTLEEDILDNLTFEDVHNVDMETPEPPGGRGFVDSESFRDIVDTLKNSIGTLNNADVDNSKYTDIYDIDLN